MLHHGARRAVVGVGDHCVLRRHELPQRLDVRQAIAHQPGHALAPLRRRERRQAAVEEHGAHARQLVVLGLWGTKRGERSVELEGGGAAGLFSTGAALRTGAIAGAMKHRWAEADRRVVGHGKQAFLR